ncbi:Uncharacterized conserved protein, DUF2147 family [Cruoricaptor ignavus]|uniref:DUF2147 domain-containing protein n=1 Tax=Cruoricaptor ignavus TaxID=1118202 RepID=A0A1M6F8V5_9FLAO|nr:DUF2147 domain-containing protein [Cruoricaptor ignavus]QOR73614.1 DUF2147 domain-containing protein [Cruoricaptor ignavus]SHI94158.1 Uncharacterized conserved protein, DUF2147 family [Cruoricaptor ignavus]
MKKSVFAFSAMLISALSFAQIEGKWQTVDDETGKPKAIVEVFKKTDGKYYAKIEKLLVKPANNNCVNCTDDRKNKPLEGMEIIRGLKKEGDKFTGGSIVDPQNGKTYKCAVSRDGNKLNVRGYLGVAALGRTQVWNKL